MWVRGAESACCVMSLRFLTGLTGPGLKVCLRVAYRPLDDNPQTR